MDKPIASTLSRAEARTIYNRLGRRLDRAERHEARARALALRLLDVRAGQRVVQVGVGTGGAHELLGAAVGPAGVLVGLDLARGMLELTRARTASPLYEGDALHLPFATASFDRLFSAYVLDLIPLGDLGAVLGEFRRVVRPGGRLALVSLTEGFTWSSRVFVAGWKLAYRIDRRRLGGCRPLLLQPLLTEAGLEATRHTVVQGGFPSEVLVANVSGAGSDQIKRHYQSLRP